MGQAKQRGTYEQRLAQAEARNAGLLDALIKMKPHPVHRIAKERGLQRLAMMMGFHCSQHPKTFTAETAVSPSQGNETP